ncbi:MAG: Gfo/Idh/MocA family oxidoreductase [Pleurocapsa minor GSE-CHR-MK-17-07R]|jgi:predicted dehydrogenase|nr:Gfo/Idh/MocA family oxidoreductase [Pleurocapsa minor GSE-CHR-MK 17-07R]
MVAKLRVGIIGVGNISPAYIQGCRAFDVLELMACADINMERARAVAEEHAIPRALSVEALLADPDIDVVVNLTVPAVHAEVSLSVLRAGKHVYSEKPLALTLADGRAILDEAAARGLRVGCAPDTFLFGQHQTARRVLDEGTIGTPVAAVAFMAGHGPESWHPNPGFFYAPGGGPMLDMGPYYVTCLVNLFGPAVRVSGAARASFPERLAHTGERIPVRVPTHYAGTIEFASGAIATLITSFDVWGHHLPVMEVYGELGTLTIPDPNGFDPREVRLMQPGTEGWASLPLAYPDAWKRGIGLADMAYAIEANRPHRASGDLAYHVLEIMSAFATAYESGQYVTMASTVAQPELLPLGLGERVLS